MSPNGRVNSGGQHFAATLCALDVTGRSACGSTAQHASSGSATPRSTSSSAATVSTATTSAVAIAETTSVATTAAPAATSTVPTSSPLTSPSIVAASQPIVTVAPVTDPPPAPPTEAVTAPPPPPSPAAPTDQVRQAQIALNRLFGAGMTEDRLAVPTPLHRSQSSRANAGCRLSVYSTIRPWRASRRRRPTCKLARSSSAARGSAKRRWVRTRMLRSRIFRRTLAAPPVTADGQGYRSGSRARPPRPGRSDGEICWSPLRPPIRTAGRLPGAASAPESFRAASEPHETDTAASGRTRHLMPTHIHETNIHDEGEY